MRLPGESVWTPGVCTGQQGPRSYGIQVGDRELRRNQRQIIPTTEQFPHGLANTELEEPPTADSAQPGSESHTPAGSESSPQPENSPTSPPVEQDINTPQPLRRSERARKPPDWITTYVPS